MTENTSGKSVVARLHIAITALKEVLGLADVDLEDIGPMIIRNALDDIAPGWREQETGIHNKTYKEGME